VKYCGAWWSTVQIILYFFKDYENSGISGREWNIER
jgi:hypothetical protein